jgi:hypothetical protein
MYRKKSFSVPATNGGGSCEQGHAMPDRKGKCIRCGEWTMSAAERETMNRIAEGVAAYVYGSENAR